MKRLYAGIGSRKTPDATMRIMTELAYLLEKSDWLLRSGHAIGADMAFERGVTSKKEIHLPWNGYNAAREGEPGIVVPQITEQVIEVAAKFHPVWTQLSHGVKKMMCRNTTIVCGLELDDPVSMVVCWTPGGTYRGGTAHGMRIADAARIPVFNLAIPEHQKRLMDFVHKVEAETEAV